MIRSYVLTLSVNCRACQMSNAVNGIVGAIRCHSCGEVNPLDEGTWRWMDLPGLFGRTGRLAEGEELEIMRLAPVTHIGLGRGVPRCRSCEAGPPLDDADALAACVEAGHCFCPACAHAIRVRAPDALCRAVIPQARLLVGETAEDAAAAPRPTAFYVICEGRTSSFFSPVAQPPSS